MCPGIDDAAFIELKIQEENTLFNMPDWEFLHVTHVVAYQVQLALDMLERIIHLHDYNQAKQIYPNRYHHVLEAAYDNDRNKVGQELSRYFLVYGFTFNPMVDVEYGNLILP